MTPAMLRQFWRSVANLSASVPENELVSYLVDTCRQQEPLNQMEPNELNHFISIRLPLIRELVGI